MPQRSAMQTKIKKLGCLSLRMLYVLNTDVKKNHFKDILLSGGICSLVFNSLSLVILNFFTSLSYFRRSDLVVFHFISTMFFLKFLRRNKNINYI